MTFEQLVNRLGQDSQNAAKVREKPERVKACQDVIDRLGKSADAIRRENGKAILTLDGFAFEFPKVKTARAAYGKARTAIRPVLRTLTKDAVAVSVWNRRHTNSEGVGAYLRIK